MSESKANLSREVARLSGVCREAADLSERASEITEPLEPDELQRLLTPLREALSLSKAAP
jgi:hypothetical protein